MNRSIVKDILFKLLILITLMFVVFSVYALKLPCDIKLNINKENLIYHTPFSPYYNSVKIDKEKCLVKEGIFYCEGFACNEDQAKGMGFRNVKIYE